MCVCVCACACVCVCVVCLYSMHYNDISHSYYFVCIQCVFREMVCCRFDLMMGINARGTFLT